MTGREEAGRLIGVGRSHRDAYMTPTWLLRNRILLWTALVGLVCSAVLFLAARAWEAHRIRLEFAGATAKAAGVLQERIRDSLNMLEYLAAFHAASPGVGREQFRAFAQSAFVTQSGVLAVEWIPRVLAPARPAFEAALRREGVPGAQITERSGDGRLVRAGARPEYYPVTYVEPRAGNERALGFDLASEPARAAALAQARDTGTAVASERLTLLRGPQMGFGFLVARALYRPGARLKTVAERREQLVGAVAGAFVVEDVVRAALRGLGLEAAGLRLTDASEAERPLLLFVQDAGRRKSPSEGTDEAGLFWSTTFPIAGRTWVLRFAPPPDHLARQRGLLPWGILLGSLAFTALLVTYLGSLLSRTAQVERQVEERTADLTATAARLGEREAHVQAVLDNAIDGILTVDDFGHVASLNAAAERIFGYNAAELIGQNVTRLMPEADAPHSEARLRHAIATGLESLAGPGREVLGCRKDGTTFPLDLAVSEIWKDGRRLVICLVRDVTERHRFEAVLLESEERFRALFEEAPVAYHEIDLQGEVTRVNRAECDLLGWPPDQIVGRPVWERVAPGERDKSRDAVLQKLAGQLPLAPFQREYQRRDGTTLSVEIHERLILRPTDGAVIGIRSALLDISHRKAVERMKDEFVSVVSHELRTPLTSIRGALGLLASGKIGELSEAGRRLLEIAVTNTDRLVRLINDILDIERMELGKVQLERQVCDAGSLMAQAGDLHRTLAERSTVCLEVEPAAARIWADPDRVLQTLANLLHNALKFSPPGTTVRLTAARQGEALLFRVTDQGRGVPADKLESIFGRFQQVDASDAREKGGTGLGLAICKSIVEQHGGRIWAESVLGQGSAFLFTIPLAQDEVLVGRR
jgi:PAS domain S-box-containing protein